MKKVLAVICTVIITAVVIIPLKAGAEATVLRAGTVNTERDPLIVRSAPRTSAAALTSLPKGSYVTLVSESDGWWYVEYSKGKFGYCYGKFIAMTEAVNKSVKPVSGGLNVRSGAGTGYKVIGSLYTGDRVLVLNTQNGWSRVVYNGNKVGYVSDKYLVYSDNISHKSVFLNVPNYKQNDSRWAKIKVGSSGKTIEQIGCTTTGISMMESFRLSSKLTPDVMVKRLSYTPSGNVYWPAHFKVVTNSNGYLLKIKEILNSGKPVLLGCKNKSGGQHWVVVTGYKNGGNAASDFLINDPGSNSRVNLAQVLSAYPTFYKFFSY